LTAAIVQGWLGRVIIPALGERVTLLGGFLLGAVSLSAYGFATQGWMIYAILPFGAMAGLGGQAGQAIISKAVPINEQGAVQGALTGLNSVAGFVAPMLAANLFSYFIGGKAPMHLPGIAFFEGGLLQILGLCVAVATLRRHPSRGTAVPTTA
jgi:DHA1 family tetracycline resistance protein-like MFS transporter